MKTLLFTSLLLLTAQSSFGACELTLYKKSLSAKTSYTKEGGTISSKITDKLKPYCKINFKMFTPDELRAMKIKRLEKQLSKLKG